MIGAIPLAWAAVGLAAGALFAPTAAWLSGEPQRAFYRLLIAGATATTFFMLAWRYSVTPALVAVSILAAVGIQLATIDVLVKRLPRVLIWPTCWGVSILLIAETISGDTALSDLLRAAAASITLAAGYLAVALASRGGLGAGDVRLAVLVGGVLGAQSWSALIIGSLLGFVCTGAVLAFRVIARREANVVPHGPGMLAGAFVALLL